MAKVTTQVTKGIASREYMNWNVHNKHTHILLATLCG